MRVDSLAFNHITFLFLATIVFLFLWLKLNTKRRSIAENIFLIAAYFITVLFFAVLVEINQHTVFWSVLSVTYRLLTLFLLTLLLIITIVFIQSKLARKENEAVGLILPTITFIIAALLLLSLSSLNNTCNAPHLSSGN